MFFKDIIGQEAVKAHLRQMAQKGIVPHAHLCTERTETDACGHCPSCLKFDALAHPDLHFVFPIVAKKEKKKEVCDDYLPEWRTFLKDNPYFGLDQWLDAMDAGNSQALIYSKESDEILRKLSLKIYEAEYRILMVWLPEKLHPTCANKLLKVIEEPPARTVILMVSEQEQVLQKAQQNYQLMQANYQAGMATLTDLFTAQTTLLKAQNDLTDAIIAYRVSARRYAALTRSNRNRSSV